MKLGSKMEQLTTLAKIGTGKSLEMIISQVLAASDIWIFGELLNMPNIQAVIYLSDYSLKEHPQKFI